MAKQYVPNSDYVQENSKYQGIRENIPQIDKLKEPYPSVDNLQNATINDDYIYLSTHDKQHNAIANGQVLEGKENSLTGYFTSEDTAAKFVNPENSTFDSYGFHRATCVSPFSPDGTAENASDKGHLDCFQIDRDRMEEIYGTRDFNAAIGKCNANNQYGPDGADQGYNANLNELYNNGCLKYAGTYDAESGSTTKCREDYYDMRTDAANKSKAILAGQSPEDVQKIGYPLDESCHQKTGFDAEMHQNLGKDYAGFEPKYNSELANNTQASDRISPNEHKITPIQQEATNADKITATPQGKEEEKPTIKQVADESNLPSKEPVKDNNLAQNQSSEPTGEKTTMNQVANENSLPKTEPKLDNSLGQDQNITQ